jgi:hypothetical protein
LGRRPYENYNKTALEFFEEMDDAVPTSKPKTKKKKSSKKKKKSKEKKKLKDRRKGH